MSDDEQEALPELEEKWKGKVEELFKMYDFDATGMIPLERLNATSMSVGAANINVLSTLAQMDYNGDGYVEMGEWEMYFATCTSVLADDEVEEVMNALSAAASCAWAPTLPPSHCCPAVRCSPSERLFATCGAATCPPSTSALAPPRRPNPTSSRRRRRRT
jgi:Ca2+-binding EF-hand superfamily protein